MDIHLGNRNASDICLIRRQWIKAKAHICLQDGLINSDGITSCSIICNLIFITTRVNIQLLITKTCAMDFSLQCVELPSNGNVDMIFRFNFVTIDRILLCLTIELG